MNVVISSAYWVIVGNISHLLLDCVGWYLSLIQIFSKRSHLTREIQVMVHMSRPISIYGKMDKCNQAIWMLSLGKVVHGRAGSG